mgnify:CR=1 FL=1|tara:strand:+ start:711 stop:1211 length:501 start_codon:yes stop_codon:yes gene_type:complete
MWIVAKIKNNNSEIFKKNISEKSNSKTIFYEPKIICEGLLNKKITKRYKSLLENYIFCFNLNFKDKFFFNNLKYTKGLEFFLDGHIHCQKEILEFINYCKSFEDKNGFITTAFFKNIVSKKAQFVSGPFMNMTFDIIEKQKNKLKISIGRFITTVPDNCNYSYRPI